MIDSFLVLALSDYCIHILLVKLFPYKSMPNFDISGNVIYQRYQSSLISLLTESIKSLTSSIENL